MLARKAVKRSSSPSEEVLDLMRSFMEMTKECIRVGQADDASTLKRLSLLSYLIQARIRVPPHPTRSVAISKAAGILASRKSMRRGHQTMPVTLRVDVSKGSVNR